MILLGDPHLPSAQDLTTCVCLYQAGDCELCIWCFLPVVFHLINFSPLFEIKRVLSVITLHLILMHIIIILIIIIVYHYSHHGYLLFNNIHYYSLVLIVYQTRTNVILHLIKQVHCFSYIVINVNK